MWRVIPDWFLYGAIFLLIWLNAQQASDKTQAPEAPPPPELGPMLPAESPRDATVLVDLEAPASGVGTAFAVDENGTWLTARHVVDGCDRIGLNLGQRRAVRVTGRVSENTDTAILSSKGWQRTPFRSDLNSRRQVGEYGYFFGFPQGRPGEAVGALLGRHRMVVRGRYDTEEQILAWTELGRTRDLKGSLGGLSGAPVLDADGEVIGLVAAESPRRGRIYSVAPKNLRSLMAANQEVQAVPIDPETYGSHADRYRRSRRIAQVICLVN